VVAASRRLKEVGGAAAGMLADSGRVGDGEGDTVLRFRFLARFSTSCLSASSVGWGVAKKKPPLTLQSAGARGEGSELGELDKESVHQILKSASVLSNFSENICFNAFGLSVLVDVKEFGGATR